MLGRDHKRTTYLASSLDFMATVSEILGVEYPRPEWTVDSKSLLPLLDGRLPLDSAREKPLGWQYGRQRALTNQTGVDCWKLVQFPAKGQCQTMLPPYVNNDNRTMLFNLAVDETESNDLCSSNPAQCDAMKRLMGEYMAGVADSAANESMCSVGPLPPPSPSPPPSPQPHPQPLPPAGSVFPNTSNMKGCGKCKHSGVCTTFAGNMSNYQACSAACTATAALSAVQIQGVQIHSGPKRENEIADTQPDETCYSWTWHAQEAANACWSGGCFLRTNSVWDPVPRDHEHGTGVCVAGVRV